MVGKRATYWAEVLFERKDYMVAATLKIVGELGMHDMAIEASRRFARAEAWSLGGCFMLVIKNRWMGSLTMYEMAEKNSGAKGFEKAWNRKRKYRAYHAQCLEDTDSTRR
jgi:hypothetical protein